MSMFLLQSRRVLLITIVTLTVLIFQFPPSHAQPSDNDPAFPSPQEVTPLSQTPGEAAPVQEEEVPAFNLAQWLENQLTSVNQRLFTVLFFDLSFGAFKREFTDPVTGVTSSQTPTLPLVVVLLALGAIFYTFYHRLINLRAFIHAWQVVFGKYEHNEHEGDVTPFRALTSALSATVGLGNIAGVAVAMTMGGPGALFWMMFLGFFGMTSKFHESTLAQLYRIKNPDGSFSGGPMFYIEHGFKDRHPLLKVPGRILAILFAICLMLAAIGGGNMFQANQAFEGFFSIFVADHVGQQEVESLRGMMSYGFGILMAVTVGFVVIGGITRIGAATARLVPFMGVVYVGSCLIILAAHAHAVPGMLMQIIKDAFAWESAYGGLVGALIIGFQRAAFSSEAGLGSSAVAHAAARTDEPAREGMVASLEPFIDTIVVCLMTGLVVLVTGAYTAGIEGGAAISLYAFKQSPFLPEIMPYLLSISIILFAFSTMLSWCYYGERAWGYLFGIRSVVVFRLIFVCFVFIGTVVPLSAVIDFADAALLSCTVPNLIGGIVLAPLVKKTLDHYWSRLKAGTLGQPANDFEV